MLVVGAGLWLAVRIHLHGILGSLVGDVVALFWEYRNELVLALGAAVVLIVPILMIYVGLLDRLSGDSIAQKGSRATDSVGRARNKK